MYAYNDYYRLYYTVLCYTYIIDSLCSFDPCLVCIIITHLWQSRLESEHSNDFDVILAVIVDNLLYVCKNFNGHSVRLCFMCV